MSGAANPNFITIGSDIAGDAMISPSENVTPKIRHLKTVFFMVALLSCFLLCIRTLFLNGGDNFDEQFIVRCINIRYIRVYRQFGIVKIGRNRLYFTEVNRIFDVTECIE
jgi:hypothetical protein